MKTMKSFKIYALALTAAALTFSCDNDDDTPDAVNEEEVITTLRVELSSAAGSVTLQSVDADGDGPNAPVVSVVGTIVANTEYAGTVTFLNETESPAEDITEEVEEEDDEHQVFFTASNGLNVTTEYGNFDSNNNPLGTVLTLTTGDASTGNFTVTLRHEPTKPNTGLADAGGETDIEVTFPITVE